MRTRAGAFFGKQRSTSPSGSSTSASRQWLRSSPGRTQRPAAHRVLAVCVRNPARPAADHPLVSTTQAAAQRQARQWDSRSKPTQLQPQLRHTHVSRQPQRRQQQQVQQQAEAGALVVPTVITSFPEHLRPEVLANGVLLVDKPPHWEVPEVVAAVQRATGADKVASVAPLDARASGLMLLCFGSATRLAPRVERAAKRYTGTLVLGGSSLSGDVRGGSFRAAQLPAEHLTDEDLREAAQGLVTAAAGVPVHGAVATGHQGGGGLALRVLPRTWRLRQLPSSTEYYEERVEPSMRTLDMELLDFRVWRESAPALSRNDGAAGAEYDQHDQHKQELGRGLAWTQSPPHPRPVVLCFSALLVGRSHVRSLIAMYGRRLRTAACLDDLRRTEIGSFTVEEAWPLEALVPVLQRHAH